MNKVELIREVANKTGFTQKDVKFILQGIQDAVFDNMRGEEGVKVFDGVTLEAVYKEAHDGRNPKTGEAISVPAKYVPHVKFGRAIKEAVNA